MIRLSFSNDFLIILSWIIWSKSELVLLAETSISNSLDDFQMPFEVALIIEIWDYLKLLRP